MMINMREYYKSAYVAGSWEKGVKDAGLRSQIAQVKKRHKMGAMQTPYESTAAALILILDQSDATVTAMGQEMSKALAILETAKQESEAFVEEVGTLTGKVNELERALKVAQDELATLRAKQSASVQPKVDNGVGRKVQTNTPKAKRANPASK